MTALLHTTRTDSLLRLAMRADAVLTGLTGVVGVPLAGWLAQASGTTIAFEKAMAAFYVAYGVVVFALATLPSVKVAGMALVLAGVFPLTTLGVVLILASGVYTLAFAELQYVGWRRANA